MTPIVVPMPVAMDRHEGDEDRDAPADERPGQHVAAERVGAERVAWDLARRLVGDARAEVLLERRLLGAEDRERTITDDDDQADQRQPMTEEPPERLSAGDSPDACGRRDRDRAATSCCTMSAIRIRGSAKPYATSATRFAIRTTVASRIGDPHDQQEVSLGDRVDEHQPETGPCEHGLGDDRGAHDLGDRQPDERDDRDEAVAERVPPQDGGCRAAPSSGRW